LYHTTKRVQLERLAVYFDDGHAAAAAAAAAAQTKANVRWVPEGGWDSLGPDDGDKWWKMFGPGIQADDEGEGSGNGNGRSGEGGVCGRSGEGGGGRSGEGGGEGEGEGEGRGGGGRGGGAFAVGRQYLLHPVGGELTYVRKGVKDPNAPGEPRQQLDFRMGSVRATLRRGQFRDIARLLDVFSAHQMRAPNAHLRPTGGQLSPAVAPRAWWAYAFAALKLRQRSFSAGPLRWDALAEGARRRRRHNKLFLSSSCDSAAADDIAREVREIEARVPYEVALTWRCLAHASLPRSLAAAIAKSSSSADLAIAKSSSSADLSTTSSNSTPASASTSVSASVSSVSPGGDNQPHSPALSLALSARKAAAAAASTSAGASASASASGTAVRTMFSKGWRWARGRQPSREVINVEGIEVQPTTSGTLAAAAPAAVRGADGGDSPDGGGGNGGGEGELFTDEDWSKLDSMMGVEDKRDQPTAAGKSGGGGGGGSGGEEIQMEVRGRFSKMSVSLQEDNTRHGEVMGSSALGVATCLGVHNSGRWEVRLGVATWVCTAPEGAVLVSGNAATQFSEAAAAAGAAAAAAETIKPPWWNDPFGGGGGGGGAGVDRDAPALDLAYATSLPNVDGKLDASLTAAVAPCHLTLERSTLARLAGFFTDDDDSGGGGGTRGHDDDDDFRSTDEFDSLVGSTPGYASDADSVYASGPDSVGGFSKVSSTGGGGGGGGGGGVTRAALREATAARLKRARAHTRQMLSLRRIAVHLEIAAPKVALPVRRADGTVRFQGLVDLGHFTFRSEAAVHLDRLRHGGGVGAAEVTTPSGAGLNDRAAAAAAAAADPYEHFHVQWRDMSIHLAAADFDWRAAGAGATVLEGCDAVLERCGAVATIVVLNNNNNAGGGDGGSGGVGPPLRVKVRLPAIAVHLSPGRIARVLAIISASTAGKERGGGGSGGSVGGSVGRINTFAGGEEDGGGGDAGGGQKRQPWECPALEGPATVLQTGARGRRGGWQRRWLALNGAYLYVLEAKDSASALAVIRLGSAVRAAYVADEEIPVAAGGSGHGPVIALHHPTVPPSLAVAKVALPGAWLLRWPSYLKLGGGGGGGGVGVGLDSEAVAERWLAQIQWSNESLLAAVGHPVAHEETSPAADAAAADSAPPATASAAAAAVARAVAANPVTFELQGELGHLKVLLSGQPMGTGDDVDDDNKGLAAIGIEGLLDGPAPGEELIISLSAKAARWGCTRFIQLTLSLKAPDFNP
jgi:hypothetical protein